MSEPKVEDIQERLMYAIEGLQMAAIALEKATDITITADTPYHPICASCSMRAAMKRAKDER